MKPYLLISFMLMLLCNPAANATVKDTSFTNEMQRIFDNFVKYEDHVDSKDNKEMMKKGFRYFQENPSNAPWQLLLNIWMYYDATDFDGLPLLETLFNNNRKAVLAAIEYRQHHKFNWESADSSPFTDLEKLKKRLTADAVTKPS